MFPELKYILVHSVIHAIATEIAGNNPSAYPLRRQLHLNFLDSSMNVIPYSWDTKTRGGEKLKALIATAV